MKKIITLFIVVVLLLSFAACEKKEIIGYEPEIPEGWEEEMEKAQNNPEINRMNDFNGLWKSETDGKYYHVFCGRIYTRESLDSDYYSEWGTMVAPQRVDKEYADNYNLAGENEIRPEDVITVDFRSSYTEEYQATATAAGENRIKTVTADGKEYYFRLLESVYNYPEYVED